MFDQAAQYLDQLRLNRLPTPKHLREVLSVGLDGIQARSAGRTGAKDDPDPVLIAKTIEDRRHAVVRNHIAVLADAVPDTRFPEVEFQFVRGVPQVFTVHAFKDDSYAIGMDADIVDLLHTLFLAIVASHEVRKFEIFATCAANLVGVYYVRAMPEEVEEGVSLLFDVYRKWPAWIYTMVDCFRDAAVQFLVSHELGHIHLGHFKEGGAVRPVPDSPVELSAFPDHTREFAADEWAATWIFKAAGKDVTLQTLAVVVPFLCFRMLSFVSRLSESGPGLVKVFDDAHPSDAERAVRLRGFAGRQLHVPSTPALDLLVKLDQFLDVEIMRLSKP